MRAHALLTLLPMLGACASATPRHDNLQSFSQAVFDAVTRKDRDALEAMLPPEREVLAACPEAKKEQLDAVLQRAKAELYEDYVKCAELDWTGAKLLRVEGGGFDDPARECKGATEVDDIKIAVAVADREHEIKINDSVFIAGGYYLAEGLRCKARPKPGAEHSAVSVAQRAADEVCACADQECAMRAVEQYARDMSAAASSGPGTEDDARLIGEASKRLADCATKLASEPAPATP